MKRNFSNLRFSVFFVLILAAAVCVLGRLFYLQALKHGFYSALAKDQHEFSEQIVPQRGEIFIQEKGGIWHPLAVNRNYQQVYLVPSEVTDKDQIAQKLSPLLGISESDILDKLKNPDDPYEPLKSKL